MNTETEEIEQAYINRLTSFDYDKETILLIEEILKSFSESIRGISTTVLLCAVCGEGKKVIITQIGEMDEKIYDRHVQLAMKQAAGYASRKTAMLQTGRTTFILAGVQKDIGELCLLRFAVMRKLMTKEDAMSKKNAYFSVSN